MTNVDLVESSLANAQRTGLRCGQEPRRDYNRSESVKVDNERLAFALHFARQASVFVCGANQHFIYVITVGPSSFAS